MWQASCLSLRGPTQKNHIMRHGLWANPQHGSCWEHRLHAYRFALDCKQTLSHCHCVSTIEQKATTAKDGRKQLRGAHLVLAVWLRSQGPWKPRRPRSFSLAQFLEVRDHALCCWRACRGTSDLAGLSLDLPHSTGQQLPAKDVTFSLRSLR